MFWWLFFLKYISFENKKQNISFEKSKVKVKKKM